MVWSTSLSSHKALAMCQKGVWQGAQLFLPREEVPKAWSIQVPIFLVTVLAPSYPLCNCTILGFARQCKYGVHFSFHESACCRKGQNW